MKYRVLGRTGLYVSEIGLGTNMFGGATERWKVMGDLDQKQADALLDAAIGRGVNLIDTSNIYGYGESERMIGEALRRLRADRDQLVISSKIGLRSGHAPNQAGLSRANLTAALDASLKRLGTDWLDIYHLHCFDPLTPIEETIRALDDLVAQGKLRYIGCSNFAAWQIMKGLGASALGNRARFESIQACYTVAKRDIEREVVPLAIDQQVGILAWGPLMGGLLTGKYEREGPRAGSGRLAAGANAWGDPVPAFDAVDVMRPIAERLGATIAQVAIAWLLHRPAVTSVLTGASSIAQLETNLGALDVILSDEDCAAIAAVAPLKPEYPMDLQTALLPQRAADGPLG